MKTPMMPSHPEPHRSLRTMKPSEAGAALHGLMHTSHLDQVREEVRASEACSKAQKMAEGGTSTDHALATLVDNDAHDPKNWVEAMASEHKEKWEQGLTKELESIEAWQFWQLI